MIRRPPRPPLFPSPPLSRSPAPSPLPIRGRYCCFCAAEPHSSSACAAPCVSIGPNLKARQAEPQNSPAALTSTRGTRWPPRSEKHTSELQSPCNLVGRLLLEKKKTLASTTTNEP